MCAQPSKSSAGGVAIYINNKFDHVKRDDLSILHDEFESELKSEIKKEKNSCVDVYRHPNTDIENFSVYIESTLSRLTRISIMSSSWAISALICYCMNLTVTPMTL